MKSKKTSMTIRKVFASLMTVALVFTLVPQIGTEAYAETVRDYDVNAAVAYAKAHWDDAETITTPGQQDCTQFLRECFEAGGVVKDENRYAIDSNPPYGLLLDQPYGYTVPGYMEYLTSNGYAQIFPLTTVEREFSATNIQWYVDAEANEDVLSVGDGVAYKCTSCGEYFHVSIFTGVKDASYENGIYEGYAEYYAQNSAVGGDPLCLIEHKADLDGDGTKETLCGAKNEVELYSIHIASEANGYKTDYDSKAVTNAKVERTNSDGVGTLTSSDELTVSWDAVDGAKGYYVFQKKTARTQFTT